MAAFLITMLIVVALLLAWVIKLLMTDPQDGRPSATVYPVPPPAQEKDSSIGDELIKKIDAKIDALSGLLKQADSKIEEINIAAHTAPERAGSDRRDTLGSAGRGDAILDNGLKARIIDLFRKGYNEDEIARRAGAGRGEVELILRVTGLKK